VFKIVGSLKKKYTVMVLGWNRENIPRNVLEGYITNLRVCNLRAPRGKSIIRSPKMVFCYAYFWMWLFIQLTKSRPAVVHSCDLDTVIPCYLYTTIFRKKLVFDIFDRYAMAFVSPKCKIYYSIVTYLEEFFTKRANVLITISKEVLCTFQKKPKTSLVIMNCPKDYAIDKEKKTGDRPFRIVFTGSILKKTRGLESIISAIRDLGDVEFIIAGWYLERDKEFLDQILANPNVKFRGLLEPNDSLALEASSDAMIALYEPQLWNNITLPNKLFEAMMCGVPLITNVASKVVNEIGFGIVVKYDDAEEIKQAILTLRDNAGLREKLGLNGRKAYLEKYNWPKMEQELLKVYDNLLPKI
jgi:glycosyltransferase involved in cell wall biosynthesis